jgi:hypothetical protein
MSHEDNTRELPVICGHRATCTPNSTITGCLLYIVNMANDDSQHSPKDCKKNILSTLVEPISKPFNNPQRSSPPAPAERNQGHSSKSRMRRHFTSTSPSLLTLSFLLTSSAENPGGEAPLGKLRIFSMYILNCNPIVDSSTVTAPVGMPPNRSSLMMDLPQYPDHRTPPASLGLHPLPASPAVQSE